MPKGYVGSKPWLKDLLNNFERAGLLLAHQLVEVRQALDGPNVNAPDAGTVWYNATKATQEADDVTQTK